jgi:hypothetical protein
MRAQAETVGATTVGRVQDETARNHAIGQTHVATYIATSDDHG